MQPMGGYKPKSLGICGSQCNHWMIEIFGSMELVTVCNGEIYDFSIDNQQCYCYTFDNQSLCFRCKEKVDVMVNLVCVGSAFHYNIGT